jgi:hypothetical protein
VNHASGGGNERTFSKRRCSGHRAGPQRRLVAGEADEGNGAGEGGMRMQALAEIRLELSYLR